MNQYADEFIEQYDGPITFRGAGSLPMSGTIKTFVKGHYMLVGDAAGMVLPSNGAGITIAMVGGRIAGQVIAEHLKDGTPLPITNIVGRNRWGESCATPNDHSDLGAFCSDFRIGC